MDLEHRVRGEPGAPANRRSIRHPSVGGDRDVVAALAGLVLACGATLCQSAPAESRGSGRVETARSRPVGPTAPPSWRDRSVAITIETEPDGCAVTVNGYRLVDAARRSLVTPIRGLRLVPGTYAFRAFHERRRDVERLITISKGESAIRLRLPKQAGREANVTPPRRPFYCVTSRRKLPPYRSLRERADALQRLLGPRIRFAEGVPLSTPVEVRAAFEFDDPSELGSLAIICGRWEVDHSVLRASSPLTSRILWPVPLLSDACTVTVTARSTGVFELNLYNPYVQRLAGTTAVARLHFGRMGPAADTDWMELSSGQRSLQPLYGFRFPPTPQEARLSIRRTHLDAQVSTDRGTYAMQGTVPPEERSPTIYVGLAGSREAVLEIHRLTIDGRVDLRDDAIDALIGMGDEFWGTHDAPPHRKGDAKSPRDSSGGVSKGTSRAVTILYTARGCFNRMLVNGQVVAARLPGQVVRSLNAPVLHRTTVSLTFGDVLAFELVGMNDDGTFHAVGVDTLTGKIVFATNPLTWWAAPAPPGKRWFTTDPQSTDVRAAPAVAQDPRTVRRYQRELGRSFPGLPVIGPIHDRGMVWLKYAVR